LGRGWHPLEAYGGEVFRWAGHEAELVVGATSAGRDLLLEVEPGPAAGPLPATVRVTNGSDAALAELRRAFAEGRRLRGFEVDRACRSAIAERGYGDAFVHRTGHSLGPGPRVHGLGANLDDWETHDERLLLPGTGFTIEPGVYFDDFGVRTEINMIVLDRDAAVTGPLQTEILTLV
jgi:hypothetical protein